MLQSNCNRKVQALVDYCCSADRSAPAAAEPRGVLLHTSSNAAIHEQGRGAGAAGQQRWERRTVRQKQRARAPTLHRYPSVQRSMPAWHLSRRTEKNEHSLPRSENSRNSRDSKPKALKLCTSIHHGGGKLLLGDHRSI
jgi:hypothetical protein